MGGDGCAHLSAAAVLAVYAPDSTKVSKKPRIDTLKERFDLRIISTSKVVIQLLHTCRTSVIALIRITGFTNAAKIRKDAKESYARFSVEYPCPRIAIAAAMAARGFTIPHPWRSTST